MKPGCNTGLGWSEVLAASSFHNSLPDLELDITI
jgi:hypothetical protein